MKKCPTCSKTFTDENLSFCVDDGTPLAQVVDDVDETTRVSSSFGQGGEHDASRRDNIAAPYQPPGTYSSPGSPSYATGKRRTWPWVLVVLGIIVLVLGGLGIAAAILIPRMVRQQNERAANVNANVYRSENRNANLGNSNTRVDNDNENNNLDDDEDAPPPTNEAEVFSDLTDLEHEWTVANINADKRKLDRILADDYVGTTPDGNSQGKAEYISTIQRDTSTQKWEFENLKVTLKGDRATMTGTIKLKVLDQNGATQDLTYTFTDKFVWRDGRWQAFASEVNNQ
ncbi:MAG TPA: DUF4440 domain-containing protein [Pyrinomonadaceae bacterium]|nr:DUF4440 domain-containing protein [Pyrinomonadaceae bacterium]